VSAKSAGALGAVPPPPLPAAAKSAVPKSAAGRSMRLEEAQHSAARSSAFTGIFGAMSGGAVGLAAKPAAKPEEPTA